VLVAVVTLLAQGVLAAAVPVPPKVLATPAHVVLDGEGPQEVELAITLGPTSQAGLADLRVHATAGRIVELRTVRAGVFTAKLQPPEQSFPQIVVVSVADAAREVAGVAPPVGRAIVSYSAQIQLRGKAEAGASMRLEIGGKRFATRVDSRGVFSLPVVVPPGEGFADSVATDNLGNASRSRINLFLPVVERVRAFAIPEAYVAGDPEPGHLFVTTVSTAGAPEKIPVEAKAARGRIVSTAEEALGVTRLTYLPPKALGDGKDLISIRAGKLTASVQFVVVAGAPAALSISATPAPTPADGQTATRVDVVAKDAMGNPAQGHLMTLATGERTVSAAEVQPGVYRVELAPRPQAGEIQIEAVLTPVAVPCVQPTAYVAGTQAKVVDARGLPCRGVLHVLGGGGARTAELDAGGAATLPSAAPEALALGQVDELIPIRAGAPATTAAALRSTHTVAWRLPIPADLRLSLVERSGGQARVRLDSSGIDDLSGRVTIESSGAAPSVISRKGTRIEVDVPLGAAKAPIDVVATDRVTGVSAWLRIE
jgi:hypothetical protein